MLLLWDWAGATLIAPRLQQGWNLPASEQRQGGVEGQAVARDFGVGRDMRGSEGRDLRLPGAEVTWRGEERGMEEGRMGPAAVQGKHSKG